MTEKSINRLAGKVRGMLLFVIALCFFVSGCETDNGVGLPVFLLEADRPDVVSLAGEIINAISGDLDELDTLEAGYPLLGQIELQPDPSNPGTQTIDCAPVRKQPSQTSDCILLNQHGDFLRAQAITWESSVFYMYRVYVAEKGHFGRVNPAKDFVALDVFVFEEPDLWDAVDQAIRTASAKIGARPYRP